MRAGNLAGDFRTLGPSSALYTNMKLIPVFSPTVFWVATITLSTTMALARRKLLRSESETSRQPALIPVKKKSEPIPDQRVRMQLPENDGRF